MDPKKIHYLEWIDSKNLVYPVNLVKQTVVVNAPQLERLENKNI